MNRIYKLKIFLVLFFVFAYQTNAETNIVTLVTPGEVQALESDQGYLLIFLNCEGVSSSIEFSKFRGRKKSSEYFKKLKFYKNYIVSLENKEKGFYLLPLIEGNYQIKKVNIPFHDLPYQRTTKNNRSWRFGIERGKINYIGELNIAKERSSNSADINLINRLAFHKEKINKQLANLLVDYPIANNLGYFDDFLMELKK